MKWAFLFTALIVGAVFLYAVLTVVGQNAARADQSAISGQTCIARGNSPTECYAMCSARFHGVYSEIRKCADSVYAASGAFK